MSTAAPESTAAKASAVLHLRGVRSTATSRPRWNVPMAVPVIAVGLALVASAWAARTGSLTLYGDARAHLDVARHVTDGITPGLTQLGSVWLPLPHILMAPLVAIDLLWHSAAAGAIVGGLSYVYSAIRLFSLVDEWLGSRRAAWVAFGTYVTNLNLLYVQSTALTEPVLLALFVGTVFHIARWTKSLSHRDLVMAAAMVLGATMTRYDGWVLLLVAFAVVVLWSRSHERRAHGVQANLLLFGGLAGYGIALWVLYNLIIFHDPLYFVHSSFSAQSQQAVLQQVGALTTKGSMIESLFTYGWAVVDVAGWVLVAVGLLGIHLMLSTGGSRRTRDLAILVVVAAPVAFNVVALWTGQSTVRVPQRGAGGMWNVRYGLMALPLLAIGAGALVREIPSALSTVVATVTVGIALMGASTPITIADGRTGTSSAAGGRPEVIANYLAASYRGGRVLIDEAAGAPVVYASGLNLRDFVTIGYHPYYEDALAAPHDNVAWVVAYDGDAIDADIKSHPGSFTRFARVVRSGRAQLLRRL